MQQQKPKWSDFGKLYFLSTQTRQLKNAEQIIHLAVFSFIQQDSF